MIIDAHAHGLHAQCLEELAARGGDWARPILDGLRQRTRTKPAFSDVHLRVEQLDRNGIDLQVVTPGNHFDSNLLPGDTTDRLALARTVNDGMTRMMEESRGRLLCAASVPLEDFEPEGRREMERAINTLGLKAISLPTNLRGKPADLPEFEPFWALAAQMDVPVYFHPTNPVAPTGRAYEAQYDLTHNFGWPFETTLTLSRLVFSGIMERFPNLKIVGHHLGGMIPFFWGRSVETYDPPKQERLVGWAPPRPLYDYFSRFYYDTAVGGSAPAIRCAYEVFGPDRLVFATDAPWGPGSGEGRLADYPKVIKSLGLPESDSRKIFAENARRMLNLA